jgi:hypothetical protein
MLLPNRSKKTSHLIIKSHFFQRLPYADWGTVPVCAVHNVNDSIGVRVIAPP